MAKHSAKSAEAIQRLLEERQQIEQWLDRLQLAGDEAPGHVRSRVEADYKGRLDHVVTELHGYHDEVFATLERHKTVREGLAKQESDASERLAEVELRHSVGEFDDDKWTELKTEILGSLGKIRDEMMSVGREVDKLEEVMALLRPRADEHREEQAVPLVQAQLERVADQATTVAVSGPEADEPTAAAQRDAFEELNFLRSVTEDERHGPAPSRASGGGPLSLGAAEPESVESGGSMSSPSVGADDVRSVGETEEQPNNTGAKTLECRECGTRNLPTEWYCERCGAELAAP